MNKRTVVVVDDHAEARQYLSALLGGHGYQVTGAANGEEALELIRAQRPSLIISDLLMPVMDGYSLLRKVRADPDVGTTPFIVYTATYTQPEDARLALSFGADAFLLKPMEPDPLLEQIEKVLRSDHPHPTTKLDDETGVGLVGSYTQAIFRKLEERSRALEQAVAELARREQQIREQGEQLAKSEAFLRMAAKLGRLGAWSVEIPSMEHQWSDEARIIHGAEPGQTVTAEELISFYVPPHRPVIRAAFESCIGTGEPFGVTLEMVDLKGTKRWVQVTGEAVLGEGGRVVRIQGGIQDVTSQMAAQEALRESKERYRSLFENRHTVMLLVDPADGAIVDANPAAANFYGWSQSQLRSMWIHEINTLSEEAIGVEMEAARLRKRTQFRFRHRLASGAVRDVEVFAGPIVRDGRELLYSIISDVTEPRRFEDLLHATVDCSPIPIFTLNTQGVVTSWNHAAERVLGWSAEEVVGTILPIVPDERQGEFRDRLGQPVQGERLFNLETIRCRKDGSRFDARLSAGPLYDATGCVTGRVVFLEDITVQVEARRQLELLAAAVNATANMIVITDRTGRIEWANPAFERGTGYHGADVRGLTPGEVWGSGAQDAGFYAQMWATILAGKVWFGELVNRRRDGSTYIEEMTITPLLDGKGEVSHFVAVKQDISARKRAEEQIRLLSHMTRTIPHPMAYAGRDYRYRAVNPAFAALVAGHEADLIGRSVADVFGEEKFRTHFQPHFDRCLAGEVMRFESEVNFDPTSPRWLAHSLFPFTGENGEVEGVVSHSVDITEERHMTQHLLRVQRLESIGTLAGGIAHDLNNILAPIFISADLIQEISPDPIVHEIIATVQASARRGADMVKQVLAFARGVEGAHTAVDLTRLLGEIRKIVTETFPRTIEFKTGGVAKPWQVVGDYTQLHQVLMNLCVNARDAMPEGGELQIQVSHMVIDSAHPAPLPGLTGGRYVCLAISDTGEGIAPEIRERIFDPFFTTKIEGKGTGLGLSVTLGVVRAHGGVITVDSVPGEGSVFTVYLPAATTKEADCEPAAGPPLQGGAGQHILVVDDESAIREVTRHAMESFGYRVTTATDGADGVAKLGADPQGFDALLIDVRMPVMGGAQAIRAIRMIRKDLPIIAMSGHADEDETREIVTLGVRAILAKPFSIDTLLSHLHRVFPPVAEFTAVDEPISN